MKQGPNGKNRLRGRNNNNNHASKGRGPSRNQVYDSNGPGVRVRGNAHQVVEKYQALARDVAAQGDRVLCESYLQHAEHYLRIILAINQSNPQRVFHLDQNQALTAEGPDDFLMEEGEDFDGDAEISASVPASSAGVVSAGEEDGVSSAHGNVGRDGGGDVSAFADAGDAGEERRRVPPSDRIQEDGELVRLEPVPEAQPSLPLAGEKTAPGVELRSRRSRPVETDAEPVKTENAISLEKGKADDSNEKTPAPKPRRRRTSKAALAEETGGGGDETAETVVV